MWLSPRVTREGARASPAPGSGGLCPPCSLKTSVDLNLPPQLDSKSVKHTALSLLSVILKRALKTVDYCRNREVWQESGVYTVPMMEDFVRLFREALSKVGTELGLAFPAMLRVSTPAGQGDLEGTEGGCEVNQGVG